MAVTRPPAIVSTSIVRTAMSRPVGATLPTVMARLVRAKRPPASVTRRRAVYWPVPV